MERRTKRAQAQRVALLDELPLWPDTVQGASLIRILQRHVDAFRDEEAHGNRELFLDDVFIVHLLAFFNPAIRSLRTVEDFSQCRQAQKHLSIGRICRSTLSDFHRLADPERLQPIIQALRAQLGKRTLLDSVPRDFDKLLKDVIAVDGTFLPALAEVAWAVKSRNQRAGECHRARLDFHVNVHDWLPELIVVPEPGESESKAAARTVTPGAIHIYDRGFSSFELMAAHCAPDRHDAAMLADFVLRIREEGSNAPTLETIEERTVSDAARAAHVVSDRWVHLPGFAKQQKRQIVFREVVVQLPEGSRIRLLTSLLDLPAEIIALLYRWRWQVELFFRWLKCYANFTHLISHSQSGVLLHFYVAVIGVLLMYLHTSARPSKYMLILLGQVAQGAATLEEILPILRERERQNELARQSAARRRAKKQA
jgi:hypothetical protein